MKRVLLVGALTLLSAGAGRALDCSQALNDSTGKLSATVITPELEKLQAEGADAKVLVVGRTSNLDFDEQAVERSCMEWRSPNGGRKSTLLVLGLSPEGHKAGIYYGNALGHALAGQWPRILHDYMAPSFRTGDFNTGTVLGLQQLGARIRASRSEALTPAQTTVNNAATDFSGLWTVLGWLLLLGALGVGGYFLHMYFRRKSDAADEVGTAQAQAIRLKNTAAALINAGRDRGVTGPDFERAAEDYARLAGSFQTDPETPDLTAAQYRVIGEGYADVVRSLRAPGVITEVETPAPVRPNGHAHAGHRRHGSPAATVAAANPSTSIFAPVIVNSENNYREPSKDTAENTSSSSSSSSSSSDDGGSVDFGSGSGSSDSSSDSNSDSGGSSSWSSDSNSSDSGGSSSWDSGSSSSDFGGGGGGSSDF